MHVILDMIISHQGIRHKCTFIKNLLLNLVLPTPEDYRALLKRIACLKSKTTRQIVMHAQYLLEQSVLADLRTVVARSLSSLHMFSGINKKRYSGKMWKATESQIEEEKMAILVEAPVGIEDALALILNNNDFECCTDKTYLINRFMSDFEFKVNLI